MLDTQWCSLVRQKLTLSRQLLRLASETWQFNTSLTNESLVQGSVTLINEARHLVLQLVARTFQAEGFRGHTLAELATALGEDNAEVELLKGMARESSSWWQHLDRVVELQQNPRPAKSTSESEGLIAVAASSESERSVEALEALIGEFRAYLESFTERYEQW